MMLLVLSLIVLLLPSIHCAGNGEPIYLVKHFDLYDETRNRSVPTSVYYPEEGGNYPIVIVSHGTGGDRNGLISHVEELVRNGYVVIVPEHVGSNKARLWELMGEGYSIWDAIKVMIGDKTEWVNRPKDISFVIDKAYEWNSSDPDLKGKMDLSKIGVMGHSFGGYTVMVVLGALVNLSGEMVGFADERIDAGLAISPPGPDGNPLLDHINNFFTMDSWKNITKPVSIHVEDDNLTEWRESLFDTLPEGDRFFLLFRNATHFSFSDNWDTQKSRETSNVSKVLALRFFDVYLKGADKITYNESFANSLCASNEIVTEIVWKDKLPRDDPAIEIKKPLPGYLYLFNDTAIALGGDYAVVIGSVSVEVDVSDGDGVDRVEFYLDGELKEIDDKEPFVWILKGKLIGWHEIKIVAFDDLHHSSETKLKAWFLVV